MTVQRFNRISRINRFSDILGLMEKGIKVIPICSPAPVKYKTGQLNIL